MTVIALHEYMALPGEPNQSLVDALRILLDKAERGDVTSVACAEVSRDGTWRTWWDRIDGQANDLLSAASVLSHRIIAHAVELGDQE